MVVTFGEEALRVAVAQICNNIGWNGIGNQSLDILMQLCTKYIKEIGKVTSAFANEYNHSESNLDDLALAFNKLNIPLLGLG